MEMAEGIAVAGGMGVAVGGGVTVGGRFVAVMVGDKVGVGGG